MVARYDHGWGHIARFDYAPSQTGKEPSRSLKATVAAFGNHKNHSGGVVSEPK
jgi:hypothetical protein